MEGFELNISPELIQQLENADNLLNKLGTDAEATQDKVNDAFSKMSTNGLKAFIDKLNEANTSLNNMKTQKLSIKIDDTSRVVDQINTVTNKLNQLTTINNKGQKNNRFALFDLSDLKRQEQEITQEMARIEQVISNMNPKFRKVLDDRRTSANNSLKGLGENEIKQLEKQIQQVGQAMMQVGKGSGDNWKQSIQPYLNTLDQLKKQLNDTKLAREQLFNERMANDPSFNQMMKEYDTLYAKIRQLNDAKNAIGGEIKNQEAYNALITTQINKINELKQQVADLDRQYNALNAKGKAFNSNGTLTSEANQITRQRAAIEEEIKLMQMSSQEAQKYSDNKIKIEEREAQERIKEIEKTEQARIKAQEKALKESERIAREQAKIEAKHNAERINSYKANNQKYNQSFAGSLEFSQKAKTINREILAIKNLEAARNKLSTADANYTSKVNQLNDAIERHKAHIDSVTKHTQKLEHSHKSLINTADQLKRSLALVFSVSQVSGYITKMVSVRGEFELQKRSLEAILQNKQAANQIWNKTVALAVKSPFQLKELVTYTKQLAAYRVESDKLFDTTKMLADVSAGLGVDMQRLILAYGQVKSANYLRGTELRQFSEAGINILGELSKYFSELEGRAVSVADVFEMVSKRLVTFKDVEAIFKRLTSAGGTFYRMQEIQANTLKGQISNLKDSMDVMLNEIGQSSEGVLKHGVSLARSIVENWENIADTLKVVIGLFAIYKIGALNASNATLMLAKKLKVVSRHSTQALTSLQMLQVGFRGVGRAARNAGVAIGKFVAKNAWLLAISAVISGIHELIHWNDALNANILEINNARNAELAKLYDITDAYNKLANAKKNAVNNKDDKFDTDANYSDKRKVFVALQNYADENAIVIPTRLEKVTPENIDEVFNETKELIELATSFGAEFEKSMATGMNAAEGYWHIFGDNFKTDMGDLDKAYDNVFGAGMQNKIKIVENEMSTLDLTGPAKDYYDEIKKGQKENEKEEDWLMRKIDLLHQISSLTTRKKFQNNEKLNNKEIQNIKLINEAEKARLDFITQRKEAEYEIDKIVEEQTSKYGVEDFSHLTQEEQAVVKPKIDQAFEKLEVSDSVKRIAAEYAAQKFKIFLEPVTGKGDQEEQLLEWQEKYNEVLSKLEGVKPAAVKTVDTKASELRKILADTRTQLERDIKNYNQASKVYKKANVDQFNSMQEELKNTIVMQEWLGYEKKVTHRGGGRAKKDRMRPMIDLIREMNREYKKLNKTLDATESKQKVLESYRKTFKKVFKGTKIDIDMIDFTSERGVVAGLKKLEDLAKKYGEDAQMALDRAISQVSVDIDLQLRKDEMEDLFKDLDGMMDDYKMSLELQKMDISPEAARNLFGVDSLTLPQMKDAAAQIGEQFTGTEYEQKFKDWQQKLDDMETKQQQERLKKYLKYTREAISERAQLKIDEMKKLNEIEESFIPKEGATEEQIKAMAEAKAAAIAGVERETREKMDKYDWEEFQKTDTFVAMFDDLEQASNSGLDSMINKLESFKNQWTDMPLEDMKQVVDLLQKLKDTKNEREGDLNPFGRARQLKQEILDNEAWGTDIPTIEGNIRDQEDVISTNQREIDMMDLVLEKKREGVTEDQLRNQLGDEYNEYIGLSIPVLENNLDINKNIIKNSQKDIKLSQDQINRIKQLNGLYAKQSKALGDIQGMANNLYDAFKSLYEALGGDSDSEFAILADMGMNMANIVLSTIQTEMQVWALKAAYDSLNISVTAFGAALNSAMGIIGWIVMAIQLLVAAFTAISKIHDNRLQKQIERDAMAVEQLKERYEELEVAIDNAMSFSKYQAAFDEMKQNLEEQIELNESMMAAEEDKKKTSQEDIDEYKEAIKDARKEMIENREQFFEDMGGFGSEENMKDQAQSFVDAWYDAFKETGNGFDALTDEYDKMIDNMMKKQILMHVSEKYIKEMTKQVDALLEDGQISKEDLAQLEDIKNKNMPELNAILTQLAESLGISGGAASKLEGLSQGIQSVTETTAQALEALLNSMRFYVIDTNDMVRRINDSFDVLNNITFDSMVDELKVQTGLIDNIKDLFDSVVIDSNVIGGKGKALAISM